MAPRNKRSSTSSVAVSTTPVTTRSATEKKEGFNEFNFTPEKAKSLDSHTANVVERFEDFRLLRQCEDYRVIDEHVPALYLRAQVEQLDDFFADLGLPVERPKDIHPLSQNTLYEKTKGQKFSWRKDDYEQIRAKNREENLKRAERTKRIAALGSIWDILSDVKFLHGYSDKHPALPRTLNASLNKKYRPVRDLVQQYFLCGPGNNGEVEAKLLKFLDRHSANSVEKLYQEYLLLRKVSAPALMVDGGAILSASPAPQYSPVVPTI